MCVTPLLILVFTYCTARADNGTNIALSKPTSARTTFQKRSDPSFAVDGSSSGNMNENTCYSSVQDDTHPWWQVDLQSPFEIKSIIIISRSDYCYKCGNRLRDFNITAYCDNPADSVRALGKLCYYYKDVVPQGSEKELQCGSPVVGRFVRLAGNHRRGFGDEFTLCEVKVFGTTGNPSDFCNTNTKDRVLSSALTDAKRSSYPQGSATCKLKTGVKDHKIQNSGNEFAVFSTLHCAIICFQQNDCVGVNVRMRRCETIQSQTHSMITMPSRGWKFIMFSTCLG